ncbi:MAG: DUF2911 domain-containing protein [Spirosomaceae bacterium]|nr:DUF2911 domain-containing protein [Spirosomataceae bacterium]
MKKNLVVLFALLFVVSASYAQKKPASPRMTADSDNVSVAYGQPSKNDREIFGKLVPYGQVWRAGANDGTEVTFKKDVDFGGAKVKAGTYTLFAIPGENEWSFILNSNLKQWGSYGYDKIKKDDVATVKVKPTKTSSTVEAMTIAVSDKALDLMWDDTKASVPLKF